MKRSKRDKVCCTLSLFRLWPTSSDLVNTQHWRIANDYNAFAQEMGDEDYILNLILRVITVSLETMHIVKALPQLTMHPLDR